MNSPRHLLFPALAALLVGAVGCGTQRSDGPRNALRQYVAAIRANKPDVAYALLNNATRQRVTKEEFRARWKGAKPELETQAKQLDKSLARPPVITARIVTNKGTTTRLAFASGAGGGWRISSGLDISVGAASPKEAVKKLLDAARTRNYLAVKRLMTKPVARAFEKEIEKRIRKVKDALKKKIVVRGNRAFLRSGDYKLELVREDGQWKIADFD